MINLPEKYKLRMSRLLGDEYESYVKSLENAPVRALRVNTDKISVADFEKINPFQTEKIPFTANAYRFSDEKIGNHPYHHAGMIYVQEPGAMMPAECIDIEPDWCVLDMCAAPGGKTSQLKNKMGENSVLVSNEIIPSRCKILTGNIERLGLKNVVTVCMDSVKVAQIFPERFDLVVVDAPCSGEGMFRKESVAISEWSEENVNKCAERQQNILENAAKTLKNGGYIIYSTCTFSLEENEMTVARFLENHHEFELVRVKETVEKNTCDGIMFDGCKCENIHFCRRFYPHKNCGEGQFAAVLHNTNAPRISKSSKPQKNTAVDEKVYAFLDDTLQTYDKNNVIMNKDTPVYFVPNFPLGNSTVFSCGVNIGEIRKNYILPHHQFFSAMGHLFKRKIELCADSENTDKYLRGEEFETDCENGWAVVTVDGCALGGAKVVNGRAKNHYPKGLRRF